MATNAQLAQMASAAYQETGAPVGWVRIRNASINPAGYNGTAFGRHDATGAIIEIVIANRGTELFATAAGSLDWQANLEMGAKKLPGQYQFAREFYNSVLSAGNGAPISLTGHSLGGSLAQLLAAEKDLAATTFNPYGAKDLIPAINAQYGLSLSANGIYNNITNHQTALDGVSRIDGNFLIGSDQLGQMQTHSAPTESAAAVMIGAAGLGGPGPFAAAYMATAFYWSHSIDRFTDEVFSPAANGLDLGRSLADFVRAVGDEIQGLAQAGSAAQAKLRNDFLELAGTAGQTFQDAVDATALSVEQMADSLSAASRSAIKEFAELFVGLGDGVYHVINSTVNASTTSALNWVAPRRDPLVLDLDGGGITTTGINPAAPILFDQDGDGLKNATGWIAAGEAIVVRDLNGNGTIDSGRELFGDNTILSHGPNAGQTAANGFAALADLDANASGVADGKFDSSDMAFNSVKLWKDLNQDGISQTGELFTFAQLGIQSINVTGTTGNVDLGGGNTQTFSGSFTRTSGQTGASGTADLAGSLLLANNNFYRQFTDDPATTTATQALPQMTGSGAVRDLRPAMSLGTTQALDLQTKLTQFAADTTKAQQQGHLDALLQSWGATSAMLTSIQTSTTLANPAAGAGSSTAVAQFAAGNPILYAQITALERFNGNTILDKWVRASGGTNVVSYSAEQQALLQQAYDALKESVYGALVVQTRLKPYLDGIGLVVGENGVAFDTAAAVAMVQSKATTDVFNAATDLIDLKKYAGETAQAVGWQVYQTLEAVLETTTITTAMQNLLTAERIVSLGVSGTNYTVVNPAGSIMLGNAGANTLTGSTGNDALYGFGGNDTISAGGGVNLLDGGDGDDVLNGDGGTNTMLGGAGNDTLSASAYYSSNNVFEGGTGNDVMNGSYYGDTYRFNLGDGQDTINENNSYGGLDKLVFGAGIAPTDITALRAGNDLVFRNTTNTDQITVTNWFVHPTYQLNTVEFANATVWNAARVMAGVLTTMVGTSSAETLTGTVTSDNITALDGNDVLNGLDGHDRLDGGTGNDTMSGGLGDDTYFVDAAGDVVIENANEGSDAVYASITYTLGANVENLVLTGAAAINGTGNSLNNLLVGNSAANTLAGGAGNDIYYVGTGDKVTEAAGAGTDTVFAAVTWTLGSNVENLTLYGSASANGTGNTLDNVLTGNGAANTLSGGAGADTMIGGAGDDTYVVDNVGDVVTELADEGIDTVQSGVAYALGSNMENLTLTGAAAINGTGNTLNNTLTGNTGVNMLTGGAGNDTYVVGAGDSTVEIAGGGNDTVQSLVSWTLGTEVENLTLAGSSAINGTGNALDNVLTGNTGVNVLTGGAGNDIYIVGTGDSAVEVAGGGIDLVQSAVTWTLGTEIENLTLTGSTAVNGTGNTLNNVLTGNSAANTLSGGAGADTLAGGLGNDIYVVDNAGDVVTENLNEGTDLVQSSVTYGLGANVENLTLTGAGAINGTGNTLDNVLTGNSGVNVLAGGAGNDSYVVGTGDTTVELSGGGIDLVRSAVTWTLGSEMENLTLTGASAINGTGNTLDNLLTGNSAANTLNGGAGADTMAGGLGNDIYVVDNAGDVVTENVGEGADLVQSSVTYGLGANVENLTLTGSTAINGTGNALDNMLTGNTGANVLTGGAGNDTYVVGTGDSTVEIAGGGIDTVQSSVAWTLGAEVENLTLTGSAAVSGTGNALDNVLTGNTGVNVLNGGAGNDTYIVGTGDSTMEVAGGGIDTVQSAVVWTLGGEVENLTLTGTSAINGTGNALDNTLTGNSAANILNGGTGTDTLVGGAGNDTYRLGRGFGSDTIVENDSTVGNTDLALFDAGVATDQLWFRSVGNDLEVSIIGTGDRFNIGNWYLGEQYHVEQFKTSDGKILLDSHVQNLVDAMASFAPPAMGATNLSPAYASQLNPVIAANWQ